MIPLTAPDLPLLHLNLTVNDIERSIAFYRRWFGFTSSPRQYPDGTVFINNRDGWTLSASSASGWTITETFDTDTYVNFRCLDPDGYQIEVYWEAESSHR